MILRWVATALRRELAARRRAEIDAAFEGMAKDVEYRAESERIEAEFAPASWEALQTRESASGRVEPFTMPALNPHGSQGQTSPLLTPGS